MVPPLPSTTPERGRAQARVETSPYALGKRLRRLLQQCLRRAPLAALAATFSCGAPAPDPPVAPGTTALRVPPPPVLWVREPVEWSAHPGGACPDDPARLAAVERSICHPESCGNGRIDPTCSFPPDSMGAEPRLVPETCDGAELGQATCKGFGYAGGSLRCHPFCVFDTSDCNACVPSPHLAACARADVSMSGAAHYLALATSESEIALAWVSGAVDAQVPEVGRAHVVHFARFRPDLGRIMESECTGPTVIGAARSPTATGLVARPGGWLLALQFEAGIALQWLDSEGKPQGLRPRVLQGRLVHLVPRPGGEPLLLYEPGYPYLGTAGVVLDSIGQALRGPVWVTDGGDATGAWTGDGFLVVAMEHAAMNPMSATRLDAHLNVLGRRMVTAETTYLPPIAWTGREAWAIHTTRDERRFLRLGRDGAPLGPPVPLPAAPRDPASIQLDGAQLFSVDLKTLGTLHFARTEAQGDVQAPPLLLSVDTTGSQHDAPGATAVARLGDDAVVAWVTRSYPGRIDLARITP